MNNENENAPLGENAALGENILPTVESFDIPSNIVTKEGVILPMVHEQGNHMYNDCIPSNTSNEPLKNEAKG
jgi:hypothetical protein